MGLLVGVGRHPQSYRVRRPVLRSIPAVQAPTASTITATSTLNRIRRGPPKCTSGSSIMHELTNDANRTRLVLARKKKGARSKSRSQRLTIESVSIPKHALSPLPQNVELKQIAPKASNETSPLRRRRIAFPEAIGTPHKQQKGTRETPGRQTKEYAPVAQQAKNGSNKTNRQGSAAKRAETARVPPVGDRRQQDQEFHRCPHSTTRVRLHCSCCGTFNREGLPHLRSDRDSL